MSQSLDERVAIVDDHEMVLDGLVAMLSLHDGIEVVGSARTAAACRAQLTTWRPTVLVIDDQLPDGSGSDLAAHALSVVPGCAVLMISGAERPNLIEDAVKAGCRGFVSKGAGTESLVNAIRSVVAGALVYPSEALRELAWGGSGSAQRGLTEREICVLQLLANPMSVTEISTHLHLSPYTVRNHVSSLLSKLNARSQLEAVVIGLRDGIILLESPEGA